MITIKLHTRYIKERIVYNYNSLELRGNAMDNEDKKAVKQKAMFYFSEKLKCHVKKVPTGFVNGIIKSELENNTFYWFEDLRTHGKDERLFLDEIFDIKDYEDEVEE